MAGPQTVAQSIERRLSRPQPLLGSGARDTALLRAHEVDARGAPGPGMQLQGMGPEYVLDGPPVPWAQPLKQGLQPDIYMSRKDRKG